MGGMNGGICILDVCWWEGFRLFTTKCVCVVRWLVVGGVPRERKVAAREKKRECVRP